MPWNLSQVPQNHREHYGRDTWRTNRYGEQELVNPARPLGPDTAGYVMNNPASWITGGMSGTGMRLGDTGRHRGTLENYLGPGLELMYRTMTNNYSENPTDAVSWMNELIGDWRTPGGAGAFAGAGDGAYSAIADLFNNRPTELQGDLLDFDSDPRDVIGLLTGMSFVQAGPQMADRFQRELVRKLDDWARFVDLTGEEIPYFDYLQGSGLLQAWGIDVPGF